MAGALSWERLPDGGPGDPYVEALAALCGGAARLAAVAGGDPAPAFLPPDRGGALAVALAPTAAAAAPEALAGDVGAALGGPERDGAGWADAMVGVIDDLPAFAHRRFRRRRADGSEATRFDMVWLQGAAGAARLGFGRELPGAEIDALLAAARRGGAVDEDGLYRAAGLIEMGRPEALGGAQIGLLRDSHATAVLDAAGGFDPDDPLARRVGLMAAALPTPVVRDTSGAFVAFHAAAAIARMTARLRACDAARRARGVAAPLPAVINISLALTAGGRDGGGPLHRAMREATALRRADGAALRFVMAAGNHRLDQARARLDGPGDAARALRWRLAPDDATPSFLEIWSAPVAARPAAPRFGLRFAPVGTAAGADLAAPAFGARYVLRRDGRLLAQAHVDLIAAAGGGWRERVTLVVPPTRPGRPGAAWTLPGDQRLTILAGDGAAFPLDLHVQRDDSLPGFRTRGRQSSLQDGAYRRRDAAGRPIDRDGPSPSPVRRSGTVSALAAGSTALVVGAMRRDTGAEAPYSGLGCPTAPDGPPHALAAADRGAVRGGGVFAGARTGQSARLSGTSLAAPMAARRLVLSLLDDADAGALDWLDAAPPALFREA